MFQEEEKRPPRLLSRGCTKPRRALFWHIGLGCNKSSSNGKKKNKTVKQAGCAIAVFRIENKSAADELGIETT